MIAEAWDFRRCTLGPSDEFTIAPALVTFVAGATNLDNTPQIVDAFGRPLCLS